MRSLYKNTFTVLFITFSSLLLFLGLLWLREKFFLKKPEIRQKKSVYVVSPLPNVPVIYQRKMTEKEFLYFRPSHNYQQTYTREDGSLIFRLDYSVDGAGYRNSADIHSKPVPKHLLITGCSLIFGIGVSYEDTLPVKIGNLLPDTAVYNLGLPGSGPSDHLRLFTDYSLKDYVSQKQGAMVYVYFLDHLVRSTMSPSYLDWAEPIRPVYGLSKNDELIYRGMLKDQEEWKNFQKIKKAGLTRAALELTGLTEEVSDYKVKLTAKIVEGIKKQYLASFPDGEFYFVVMPHTYPYDQATQKVVAELKKLNITIAPYEEMTKHFQVPIPKGQISPFVVGPEEGHPSAYANELFAKVLVEWLNKQ